MNIIFVRDAVYSRTQRITVLFFGLMSYCLSTCLIYASSNSKLDATEAVPSCPTLTF